MAKIITANIPARTIRFPGGKTRQVAAYSNVFECDDEGQWTVIEGSVRTMVRESDVIESCAKAKNWADIRREHFPMVGFHN